MDNPRDMTADELLAMTTEVTVEMTMAVVDGRQSDALAHQYRLNILRNETARRLAGSAELPEAVHDIRSILSKVRAR